MRKNVLGFFLCGAYDSFCKDKASPFLTYTGQVDMDAEGRIVDSRVDIGADEVYSCDGDLTEDDIYHSLDWTADGIVNFHEFIYFAQPWRGHDPNDPALSDPNLPDYESLHDPNSPDYVGPGNIAAWNARCNLDGSYRIDAGDLVLFCDQWLWMACWKQSQMDSSIMMMGMGAGAESTSVMTRDPLVMEPAAAPPWSPEWLMTMGESEQVSFVIGIYAVLDYIDAMIQEKPPNTETLYELQAFLLECLEDIKATREYQSMLNGPKIYNYPE